MSLTKVAQDNAKAALCASAKKLLEYRQIAGNVTQQHAQLDAARDDTGLVAIMPDASGFTWYECPAITTVMCRHGANYQVVARPMGTSVATWIVAFRPTEPDMRSFTFSARVTATDVDVYALG